MGKRNIRRGQPRKAVLFLLVMNVTLHAVDEIYNLLKEMPH